MSVDIAGLIARLRPSETSPSNQLKVLRCFSERGVATTDQVVALSRLGYDTVYQNLAKLCNSQGGAGPALRFAQVAMEGERGKPRKVHILTETGAAALRFLEDLADLRAPKLEEHTEIAAAVMTMDVYVAARQAGLEAKVEHVIPFGPEGSSIRADVWVTLADGTHAIFECEQLAAAWSKARIQDKLRRLVRFFSSDVGRQAPAEVRVLFNIHPGDVQSLLTWQEQVALIERELGRSLPFSLHWQRITDFLKQPEWSTLTRFQPLLAAPLPEVTEPAGPASGAPRSTEVLKSLPTAIQASLSSLKELELALGLMYRDQQAVFQEFQAAQNPRERARRFFALMLFIYEASHYANSPTLEYATLPVESLYLLRRYLHAHQNAKLLAGIKQGLNNAAKNSDGVTRYRNAMTRFIWDVFLRWHGFARGGPLRVKVEPPGFETGRSDFYVEVFVSNPDMFCHPQAFRGGLHEMHPEERALAWVLEAMVNYPAELGLE